MCEPTIAYVVFALAGFVLAASGFLAYLTFKKKQRAKLDGKNETAEKQPDNP